MEKTLQLKAEIRRNAGSKSAERIRRRGQIPAIVYGHKQEPVAISMDAHDFVEGLHHGHRLMDVQIGGKRETMMVKDLQYDYVGKNIIHVDLMRVDVTEIVVVSVPVELKGTAKGAESSGGMIEVHTDRFEVRCRVADIPESIVVAVKDLDVGDSIHAGDIELPEGVKLASDPGTLVVACHLVAATKTTEQLEEEAPMVPEVIGEAERAGQEGESSGQADE